MIAISNLIVKKVWRQTHRERVNEGGRERERERGIPTMRKSERDRHTDKE